MTGKTGSCFGVMGLNAGATGEGGRAVNEVLLLLSCAVPVPGSDGRRGGLIESSGM